MASAWGKSWAKSWGNSWGSIGGASGGGKKRKQAIPAKLPTLITQTQKKREPDVMRLALLVYGSGLR
jgi:hypothetical protein